jgi:hypothetical protein
MPTNSDHFDLENWKITLPVDSKGKTSGTAKEVKNLIGYEDRFFYDAKDGAMIFKAGVDGATTSGSKYARTELREMDGSDRATWKLSEGGTLTATLKVDETPIKDGGTPGRVVVGFCRKFSFKAICGMVSPSNPCSEGGERRWRSASKGPISLKTLFSWESAGMSPTP